MRSARLPLANDSRTTGGSDVEDATSVAAGRQRLDGLPVDNDVYAVGVPRGVGVEPRRRCLWTVRGQLAARPGSPGQTLSPACGRRIVVPVCLLYTSDAADE